jgi:hypothetical protein
MREATGGQDNTALLQFSADLPALLVLKVAGTAHVDDQIVAVTLAVQNQPGQCVGAHDRMGRIATALLECLDSPERPRLQGVHLSRARFVHPQGAVAYRAPLRLGDKLDARRAPIGLKRCPYHLLGRAARLLSMHVQQTQDLEPPPFLSI